jgi:hypothetical protein
MARLHQMLAVLKNRKPTVEKTVTRNYQALQKPDLFKGATRTYKPLADDGQRLPSESAPVKVRVSDVLDTVQESLISLFDATYDVEEANQRARADIEVDGQVLLTQVPVTYLLFLEKQLTDIRTVLNTVPVLDPSIEWTYQQTSGLYMGPVTETVRSVKIPQVLVRYEATDKHPAQTEVWQKEEPVGTWTTRALSGAIPQPDLKAMQARVAALLEAVKLARGKANEAEVSEHHVGSAVLGYILNGS